MAVEFDITSDLGFKSSLLTISDSTISTNIVIELENIQKMGLAFSAFQSQYDWKSYYVSPMDSWPNAPEFFSFALKVLNTAGNLIEVQIVGSKEIDHIIVCAVARV